MPVLTPSRTVRSATPTLLVENPFVPGSYRFELVVVDDSDNVSVATDILIRVRERPAADPRVDPRIDPRVDPRIDPRIDPRLDARVDPRVVRPIPVRPVVVDPRRVTPIGPVPIRPFRPGG